MIGCQPLAYVACGPCICDAIVVKKVFAVKGSTITIIFGF
jgi:hypothetical protein